MNVELLETQDPACDVFVRSRPEGKICHLFSWGRAAEKAMGHKCLYLVARDEGVVRGVLPMMHVRSRLFGRRMVSQALSDYGGVVADSHEAQDALFGRAVELATEFGCESIEFRNVHQLPYDLVLRSEKMTMHLSLPADPQELWKSFPAKVRNQVRKAEKSGIVAADGGAELLPEIYPIYANRMHQLGTPCYSRKVMKALLDAFPDNTRVFAVRLNGRCIGGSLSLHLDGFVEMPFAAVMTKYNNLCPNNLLYWSVLEHYCRAGARMFDFGRCTVNSGTHQFKKQWGSQAVDLNYQYWVQPGIELSLASPSNQKYQKKVEMWRRLPQWLARLIGPAISRSLP